MSAAKCYRCTFWKVGSMHYGLCQFHAPAKDGWPTTEAWDGCGDFMVAKNAHRPGMAPLASSPLPCELGITRNERLLIEISIEMMRGGTSIEVYEIAPEMSKGLKEAGYKIEVFGPKWAEKLRVSWGD